MEEPLPASAPRMARRSIGETAADTVMMQVRWPGALLKRLDQVRGDQRRAEVIRDALEREVVEREAVAEKLAREKKGRTDCADSRDEVNRG